MLARTAADSAGNLPAGATPVIKALEQAKLANAQPILLSKINEARAAQGLGPATSLTDLHIPKEAMDSVTRYLRPFSTPDAVSGPLSLFDRLTSLTKAWQTAPFPGFHVRNFASGVWQNLMEGGNDVEGGLLKQGRDAYHLMKGGTIDAHAIPDFAARGLSPEEATKELAQEMYAWGIGGHKASIGREVVGPLGDPVRLGPDLESYLSRIPGEAPRSIGGAISDTIPKSLGELNPLDTEANALIRGGRQMGDVVEGVNRGSLYTSLRRQGYTPEAAAKQVLKSHFDYTRGNKTDFEAKVLSRVIPFYSFARGNIPYQAEQLLTHPGGAAATLAKTSQDLRQQAGFLPDYLGAGLAVPLGEENAEGTKRFLTRLDLPPEQAFEMLHGGPNALSSSLMGILGQTNPLIKGPLEQATGKQFFTGRDLEDLYSGTGSPIVDQLIANSPASRVATTLRTLTDERKWQDPLSATAIPLNLLTGAKVSDVDIAKQRTIAEREYLTEMLRGDPNVGSFSTVYPKVNASQMTPQELLLLRLNKTIEQRANQAAKQKAIQIQ